MKEFKINPDVVDNVGAVGMSGPVNVLYTLYCVYHTVTCIVLCVVCVQMQVCMVNMLIAVLLSLVSGDLNTLCAHCTF